MPLLSAETFPLLPPASPQPKFGRFAPVRYDAAPSVAPQTARDAGDVADRSYWTAYDHYMVEREAREMRRVHVWMLLARIWSAIRPWFKA